MSVLRSLVSRTLPGLILLLSIAIQPGPAHADRDDSHWIVFGDSLSDPGNFFALTGMLSTPPYFLVPEAPYAVGSGHFSNGETWIEQLSHQRHTRIGPAYRNPKLGNFAVGGARARNTGAIDLTEQINTYLATTSQANDDTIYFVMIGSNDLRDAIEALAVDSSGNASFQILMEAVASVQTNLQTLAYHGATTIVIANAPDLSLVPAVQYQGPAAIGAANFLTVQYNAALDQLVNQLQVALPVRFIKLDLYNEMHRIFSSPALFGLNNITTPCINPGVIVDAVCTHPDRYFFWDGIHPTRAGHSLIAAFARDVLPMKSESKHVHHK